MKKMIFGLDISDKSIEVLQLERAGGKVAIAAYARVSLRGELVSGGSIKKPDQLAAAIKELLKTAKPKSITTKECVLSLPESQVFTTVFSLPAGLKRQEILQTIPLKAEEVIPFKAVDIYFDFKTIRVDTSTQDVFYVAVPKKIVEAYVSMLAKAGLQLVALDVESISTARAVLTQARGNAEPTLLMDIGARTTNLTVFDRQGVRDSRTLKLAGSHFTKAIARKLNVSVKEAEALKVKNGLDQTKQVAGAYEALQKESLKLSSETQKFAAYYYREHHRRIGEVVLVGGSALVPGLDQFLSKALKLSVRRGDPLEHLNDPHKVLKQKGKAVIFANVTGVALRAMAKNPQTSDINLLPVVSKPALARTHWTVAILMLAVAAVAVAVALYIRFGMQLASSIPPRVYQPPAPAVSTAPTSTPDTSFVPTATSTATTTAPTVATPTSTPTSTPALGKVKIRQTTVGYINVREQPTTASSIIGKANTGQEFPLVTEQNGWINIQFSAAVKGWVSAVYVDKLQ